LVQQIKIEYPWQLVLHVLGVVMVIDNIRDSREFSAMFDHLEKWIPGDNRNEKNTLFTTELIQAITNMGNSYEERKEYCEKLFDSKIMHQKGVLDLIIQGSKIVIEADGLYHPQEKTLLKYIVNATNEIKQNQSKENQVKEIRRREELKRLIK